MKKIGGKKEAFSRRRPEQGDDLTVSFVLYFISHSPSPDVLNLGKIHVKHKLKACYKWNTIV